jgi:hypothetical protein
MKRPQTPAGPTNMDANWRAEAHLSMWRLAADPRLCELRESARRIARDVVTPAIAAGAADSPGWTPAKAAVLDQCRTGLLACPLQSAPAVSLGLVAAELAVADGGAATSLLSGYLAHSVVRDFGTPEQRARYLDRVRYPHASLCLTEPPPGAGVDALTLTGTARLVETPPGAEPMLDVEKRGRLISHMEFADFVLLAVDSPGGGCLIVAEPSDEAGGLFDRGQPVRTLGHRLSSVTSPAFRLRLPACRILGGYTFDDGRLVPRVGYRQALEPALARCRPIVALMTAGKLLATMESVLGSIKSAPPLHPGELPSVAQAVPPANFISSQRLVDAWAAAEAAVALALEAARLSDALDADTAGGLLADVAITGAAARLFATAHAAQHMVQYAELPGVLQRLVDAQVESVYLGAESVQRRQLAAAMAAPAFPSRLAAWAAEAAEPGSLPAGFALLAWTLEFLRRARLLTDARQGAGFALADALCRLLAARALAAGVRTLRADRSPCEAFFTDLSVVESAAAASAVAHVCTSLVFGHTGPAEEDLRNFSRLRASVDASFAGVPAARLRAAAFLLLPETAPDPEGTRP